MRLSTKLEADLAEKTKKAPKCKQDHYPKTAGLSVRKRQKEPAGVRSETSAGNNLGGFHSD